MIKRIMLLLLLIFVYIITINLIPIFIQNENITYLDKNLPSGSSMIEAKMLFSQHVDVSVIKHRWYGTIYEDNGDSYIYVFNFIGLPLKQKINFLYFHISFLILIIFLILFVDFNPQSKKFINNKILMTL